MKPILDIDRCLTVAAYSAFIAMRRYLEKNPDSTPDQAIQIIRTTNSDDADLDYVGGQQIYSHMNDLLIADTIQKNMRLIITEIICTLKPWWIRSIPYGREKLRVTLNKNQVQCFMVAGLFEAVPDTECISWWDEMAALVRGTAETERMIQAREAELLSLEHEIDRLRKLGINRKPSWISPENNTLGYDIHSYDKGPNGIVNRLIEVKRTASDKIFITRNEWNNALSTPKNYLFHIWYMPDRKLVECSVEGMGVNIPRDQGAGVWQSVRVNL